MAIVKKYRAKVEQIINPVSDLYTVTFSSEKRFKYLPGQFLHLALDEYDGVGQWPESRCFSMQSNPNEELLKITFAVKGKFTKRMAEELKVGKYIWLKLPYGDLFQRNNRKDNCVFIAGGTGITPFLSLFTHESFNEYINTKIYLGFKTRNHNIYGKELQKVLQSGYIKTQRNKSAIKIKIFYEDEDGIIDIKTIFEENGTNINYIIAGPAVMIKSFKKFLIENGLPDRNVVTDDWE